MTNEPPDCLKRPCRDDGKMCIDMKTSRTAFLGIFFHCIFCFPSFSQNTNDSLSYKESVTGIREVYFNGIHEDAQIYHGNEYIRNGQKALGFPFYESNDMLDGSIYYQGTGYPARKLYYDLVSDEIVISNYPQNALIALSAEKADSFRIDNHLFVYLPAVKSNGLPRDGYYEQLYSGEPGFFARREKKLVTGSGSEEIKYVQYNSYYVRKNQVYYSVESKSSLLEQFRDKEEEIKKYIRSNKLNFKKDPEKAMVLATIYYSQLKH